MFRWWWCQEILIDNLFNHIYISGIQWLPVSYSMDIAAIELRRLEHNHVVLVVRQSSLPRLPLIGQCQDFICAEQIHCE